MEVDHISAKIENLDVRQCVFSYYVKYGLLRFRNDDRKFSNINKTVSRRSQAAKDKTRQKKTKKQDWGTYNRLECNSLFTEKHNHG